MHRVAEEITKFNENSGRHGLADAPLLVLPNLVGTDLPAATITRQPASQFVLPGQNVTLSIIADGHGPAPTYQWRRNSASLTDGHGRSRLGRRNFRADGQLRYLS